MTTYSLTPKAFATKKAAADFVGMNASTLSKKLKAADGELYIDGFYISERDEICVFTEELPLAEEITPTPEAIAQIQDAAQPSTDNSEGQPFCVEDEWLMTRAEVVERVGCSLSRVAELVRDSRNAGRGVGKTVKGVYVFVCAEAEDALKAEAKARKQEAADIDDASKLDRLEARFAKKAAKYLKLGAELEDLAEAINALRDTNDDIHVMMAAI